MTYACTSNHEVLALTSSTLLSPHTTPRPAMRLPYFLDCVAVAACASSNAPTSIFFNPADSAGIPSSYESAVMARRILALSKLVTLSTVFPNPSSRNSESWEDGEAEAAERRPQGLDGLPIGLMDYAADCEDTGNPTLLAIGVATTFKNARAGSNVTMSVRWTPPYPPSSRISLYARLAARIPFLSGGASRQSPSPSPQAPDPVPYSAANLPRFSLVGYLEPIDPEPAAAAEELAACFTRKHRDARWWLPGNLIHDSEWARLVVTQVYWIGGFGDRAYIGWIPIEEWRNVTAEEWQGIKLPGEEKGWSEWTVTSPGEL